MNELTSAEMDDVYFFDELQFTPISENKFCIMPKSSRQNPILLTFDKKNFHSYSGEPDLNEKAFNKKDKLRVPGELSKALLEASKIQVGSGINKVGISGAYMPPVNKDDDLKSSLNEKNKINYNLRYSNVDDDPEFQDRNIHNVNKETGKYGTYMASYGVVQYEDDGEMGEFEIKRHKDTNNYNDYNNYKNLEDNLYEFSSENQKYEQKNNDLYDALDMFEKAQELSDKKEIKKEAKKSGFWGRLWDNFKCGDSN